jgi:hypothetical protein
VTVQWQFRWQFGDNEQHAFVISGVWDEFKEDRELTFCVKSSNVSGDRRRPGLNSILLRRKIIMIENRVSVVMSQTDLDAALAAVQTLMSTMTFLISLTTEERTHRPKFGPSSVDFVNGTLEVATQNSQVLPPVFNLAEWKKDVDLLHALTAIWVALKPLVDKIDDTRLEVGAEAYAGALAAYGYLQKANLDGSLKSLLDDLGQRFAKKSGHQGSPNQLPPNPS